MNILLIIGNGFDLNLNLKTSYKDFYKYLNSKSFEINYLEKFKKEINKDIENWSDLELALGRYSTSFNEKNYFTLLLEKIKDALADYIIEQEDNFKVDFLDLDKFKNDLIYPENYLPKLDKDSIEIFKKQWRGQQFTITFFTFNYTRILDDLLINEKINSVFSSNKNGSKVIYRGIYHIHGTANDGFVLGLNDISQLQNNNFIDDINLRESFIKPECNNAMKHGIPNLFENTIKSSNLIILFGSSIGDTDKVWWNLIGEQLKKNCRLIYFIKGEKIPPRHKHKIAEVERQYKGHFISKTDLLENDINLIKERIFIGYNTEMFNLIESIK